MYNSVLIKAEESHGRQVVGHTSSGKPIYKHLFHSKRDSSAAMSDYASATKNYDSTDHADAMNHHLKNFDKEAAKYVKNGMGRGSAQNHFRVAKYHASQPGVKTDREDVKTKTHLEVI